MIRGSVNADIEATIPVKLLAARGPDVEIVAVIDTGYSGLMSLPSTAISSLGLPPLSPKVVRLADGTAKAVDTYEADVMWDGQQRSLRILALDGDPLVGTGLLRGYDFAAEFVDGGAVTLVARP